ncbi:hypothetical protein [uncultured Bradyrhizobium sp.]|uniref:hypothetical protein n=1 Tax=uncultured Bradyrhizobium sp. TaxID=199684 RepID=UPI0035CA808C
MITFVKKPRQTSTAILEATAVILAGVVAIGILRVAGSGPGYCPATAPSIVTEDPLGAQTEVEAAIKDMMLHD